MTRTLKGLKQGDMTCRRWSQDAESVRLVREMTSLIIKRLRTSKDRHLRDGFGRRSRREHLINKEFRRRSYPRPLSLPSITNIFHLKNKTELNPKKKKKNEG